MNSNLDRWITASVYKYLSEALTKYPVYIETAPRHIGNEPQWFELRLDGPEWYKRSSGWWDAEIEVNVLVTVKLDNKTLYTPRIMTGQAVAALAGIIPVLKLGDGAMDDGSTITCLKLITTRRDGIQVSHFGLVRPESNLTQATVEAHYTGEFNDGSI